MRRRRIDEPEEFGKNVGGRRNLVLDLRVRTVGRKLVSPPANYRNAFVSVEVVHHVQSRFLCWLDLFYERDSSILFFFLESS
jgi:hypothetical protein